MVGAFETAARDRARRVLFLDVDGVLHPFSSTSFFHAPCMSALRQIVQQTGAAIVLSSSWQGTPAALAQVNAALERNGIPVCIDTTVSNGRAATLPANRAGEIKSWVEAHAQQCLGGYVVVDDMDLHAFLPPGTFVRTEDEVGLTEADAMRAIQLLGGPDKSLPPLPPPPRKPGGFNVLVTRGEMQREMMRAAMAGM